MTLPVTPAPVGDGPGLRRVPPVRRIPPDPSVPRAMRALIRVRGAVALVPATTRLTITGFSGDPVAEVTLTWGNVSDAEAGLRAILEALRILRRYGARRVVAYVDNEDAAAIAAGDGKAPPALVGLALQVRALAHTYRNVVIRHGVSSVAPTLPEMCRFASVCSEEVAAHVRISSKEET